MRLVVTIDVASVATGIPAATIRRWLSEGRLCRHGQRKPWRVDVDEVRTLRELLARPTTHEQS